MMSNENVDSLRENMADIAVPTQVIWGVHDRVSSSNQAQYSFCYGPVAPY